MKGRWIPFLATTAALALAVVAPAQDRGRRGGGGGGGNERSSPPSRGGGGNERSGPPPSRERTSPPPSRERTAPPTRNDPPTRSGGDTTFPRRTGDPGGRERRPSYPPTNGGGDGRPTNAGGDSRPTRGSDGGSRRNPFDRNGGDRTHEDATRGNDRGGNNGGVIFNRNDRGDRNYRDGRPSRSGNVSYGTRSNGYGNARPVRYGSSPSRTSLGNQIRRTDIRVGGNYNYGGVYGGLRVGYVGYNSYWTDNYFSYPFYVFNPWTPNLSCVASPWYRYSYLPGYINTSRVVVVNNYTSNWDQSGWNDYDYRYDARDRRDEAVSNALDDIRDAFERGSSRYGDRVAPQTGQVAIFNDGKYDYSLGAEDFQDMFLDGIEQSKTIRYEIIESKVRGDEVKVRARHEYTDSWGANQVVFHSYTLRRERDGKYVIREFGTD